MSLDEMDIDELCVNTIRTLSADMTTKAGSGHPGAPLGAAAMTYALWQNHLKHNPLNPCWPNRDRFMLSAGHASALLYSMLYLTGYDLDIEDLKQFRQFGSKTPGHPEIGHPPGVEITTGPLGQGLANAVGMAMAERYLAEYFNRDGLEIMDHYSYALCSDGDFMEGISHEACSLAGHLGLGRLIVLYDDNEISLDGPTSDSFSDDTMARMEAYGWQVIEIADGNDVGAVCEAIGTAKETSGRPTLIKCRTHIGYGSPLQDTNAAHGKPLDEDLLRETKKNLGWPEDEMFLVPERARKHMQKAVQNGKEAESKWHELFDRYEKEYPGLAAEWKQAWSREKPGNWNANIPSWKPEDGPISTRDAAGKTLDAIRKNYPMLIGGDADIGSSTRTVPSEGGDITRESFKARNIRFGVREHVMASACNGMVAHGALRAFCATFLVFADYARPGLRMAAMQRLPVIYQFTHDSIGVGEDGPTHQPVEQIASLRCMPNMTVIRPADANEAAVAWQVAIEKLYGPTAIMCTRQKLPVMDRTKCASAEGLRKGAYVLIDSDGETPDILLLASGSEVEKAVKARETLAGKGVDARVISFPSWELFEAQPEEYRNEILPPEVTARLAIEAGSPQGWHRWVGSDGEVIGMTTFGASGPFEEVMEHFGFTAENIVQKALSLLD
jgi:transketolase